MNTTSKGNQFKIIETLTVDDFKERMQTKKIDINHNRDTGQVYCTWEGRGQVASTDVTSENAVMSLISDCNGEKSWILHEQDGDICPIILRG